MTDKVRYLQKTITVSTALPMPHTAGSTTTQRLYLKSSKQVPSIERRGPKPERAQLRALKTAFCIHRAEPRRASYPAFSSGKPAESLAQPGYLLIQFSFLSSGSRTTATSLLLAPLLGLLDGESRGLGKANPNPFINELSALPRAAGRSRAEPYGPVQATKLHSYRFMDLSPPPARPAFALGRCFPGFPFIASLAPLNRIEP